MQRLVLLASSSCRPLAPLLSSIRHCLEAHASKLSLTPAFVEVGSNNSPEHLNQGYDVAAVVSVDAGTTLSRDAASSLAQQFEDVCVAASCTQDSTQKTKVLSLRFTATPSPHCSPADAVTQPAIPGIRHFVAWKFLNDRPSKICYARCFQAIHFGH